MDPELAPRLHRDRPFDGQEVARSGPGRRAGGHALGAAHRPGAILGARLELLAELHRPSVGGPDRLGQDRPEPARFELVEGGRAGPAGRGDHVPEDRRVVARLLREVGRALERLDHQVVGDVPREAEVDGRVDERLHDQEDVGRAGPGDRGGHRHELLVVDLELGAERLEERARLGPLLGGRLRGGVPDRHPATEPGRRVGHAPDDPAVAQVALEGRRGGPGDDRQDELVVAQVAADLAADPVEHLGLDREQDDVGAGDRLERCPGPSGSRTASRARPAARPGDGWRRPGRGPRARPRRRPGDHRLGHDPGADGGDRPVREG